jgi:hypothetical protein
VEFWIGLAAVFHLVMMMVCLEEVVIVVGRASPLSGGFRPGDLVLAAFELARQQQGS